MRPNPSPVYAGSVLSALRLKPGNWAGAAACWGLENREAAVRFIAATPGSPHGANAEPNLTPLLDMVVSVPHDDIGNGKATRFGLYYMPRGDTRDPSRRARPHRRCRPSSAPRSRPSKAPRPRRNCSPTRSSMRWSRCADTR